MALSSSFMLTRVKGPSLDEDRDPNEPLPWPNNMTIYIPTDSQMNAENLSWCSAIAAILELCNLGYQIERCTNFDYLAPNKLWPVLRSGNSLAAGFENIIFYIKSLGYLPSLRLSDIEKAESYAFMVYIDSTLHKLEKYLCWCVETEFRSKTLESFASVHSWPLNKILPELKRFKIRGQMKTLGYPPNEDGVNKLMGEFEVLCKAVLSKAGDGFLFGDNCTEVDVTLAAHVKALDPLLSPYLEGRENISSLFPHLLDFAKKCHVPTL